MINICFRLYLIEKKLKSGDWNENRSRRLLLHWEGDFIMKCWHPEEKYCQNRSKNFHCRLVGRKRMKPCSADIEREKNDRLTLAKASGNVDMFNIYNESLRFANENMELMRSPLATARKVKL